MITDAPPLVYILLTLSFCISYYLYSKNPDLFT